MAPSAKMRRLATLYVWGPDKGDLDACAATAGYKTTPKMSDALQKLIDQEKLGEQISEMPDTDEVDWLTLANKAVQRLDEIASGAIVASTQEVAALKELIARGHGKVGQMQVEDDKREIYVAVLPTFGTGEKLEVCPYCLHTLIETKTLPHES